MKKLSIALLLFLAATLLTQIIAVFAQGPISSWPFLVEVTPPQRAPGIYTFVVPLEVMAKSREDLADLRLLDGRGGEIPYALIIRQEIDDRRQAGVSVFNRATIGSASEISVDLGENAGPHNEVEVDTGGTNFRRRVEVEGSETGTAWRLLKAGDLIFGFEAQNQFARSNRVEYPLSRYRYLRVRIYADELTDKGPPVINEVKVMMAVHQQGELATWDVLLPEYRLLRNQGAPASAWTIDLGGRVPVDRLALEVGDESFSRQFQLEQVDDPQNIRLLASGELTRRLGEERQPLKIRFDNEEQVQKLRLLITDYSNQKLSISSIKASAPARQLIFELKETDGQPLHLYFGQANATAPHYDFEKELPGRLTASGAPPVRSNVGNVINNPEFKPAPLPFTERVPWLIYLVLAVSSIALALILISLARTTMRRQPQTDGADL